MRRTAKREKRRTSAPPPPEEFQRRRPERADDGKPPEVAAVTPPATREARVSFSPLGYRYYWGSIWRHEEQRRRSGLACYGSTLGVRHWGGTMRWSPGKGARSGLAIGISGRDYRG
jgi:hypothetical protein